MKSRSTNPALAADEIGAVRKSWQGRLRVVLAVPNTYAVGMSNLGFQTVYDQLNRMDNVVCERLFLPETPAAEPRTVESNRRPAEADLLAFSISFENDYPNLLTLLERSGLTLRAEDRPSGHPLVVAGGVACMLNPEPIAPFLDAVFVGEAEPILPALVEAVAEGGGDRAQLLLRIAQRVPGAYVPGFYRTRYHRDGTLAAFEPIADVPAKVRRPWVQDLSGFSTLSAVVSPHTTFESRFLVEVSRGCPHGCRFCSAGFIYRPARFRSADRLRQDISQGLRSSDRIGLVGAAVSDLPCLPELCAHFHEARLSFSSLRADALSAEVISALARSRVKTATIAPDAGSQRLRNVINKGIDQETVLASAEALVAAGIPNLKLYFMVGLPTETAADVEAIVELGKKIRHRFLRSSRTRGRIGEITVSLSSFVPKPFTPFQWAAMDELSSLKEKLKRIKEGLRQVPNLKVHTDVPRWALVQGLLSRGDRQVADLLQAVHKNGGNWPQTLKANILNPGFYLHRERSPEESFPWDFIDHGLHKSFLLDEYQRALAGKRTADCPGRGCSLCGVCPKPEGRQGSSKTP